LILEAFTFQWPSQAAGYPQEALASGGCRMSWYQNQMKAIDFELTLKE